MSSRRQTEDGLTQQESLFIDAYVVAGLNGVEAARKAGYAAKSDRSLAVTASRILARERVRDALRERWRDLMMEARETVARVSAIARGSMDDFVDDRGQISIKRARERGVVQVVRSYSTRTRETRSGPTVETRIELHSSMDALRLLVKLHGLVISPRDERELPGTEAELDQYILDQIARVKGKLH